MKQRSFFEPSMPARQPARRHVAHRGDARTSVTNVPHVRLFRAGTTLEVVELFAERWA